MDSVRHFSRVIVDKVYLLTAFFCIDARTGGGTPSSTVKLCGLCLVDKNVPVFRQNIQKWSFGQVEAYRKDTNMFCFCFGGSTREWLPLDEFPFLAYTRHHRLSEHQSVEKIAFPRLDGNGLKEHSYLESIGSPTNELSDILSSPGHARILDNCIFRSRNGQFPVASSRMKHIATTTPGMNDIESLRSPSEAYQDSTYSANGRKNVPLPQMSHLKTETLSFTPPTPSDDFSMATPSPPRIEARPRWTPMEDSLLYRASHTSTGGSPALIRLFPKRSHNDVEARLQELQWLTPDCLGETYTNTSLGVSVINAVNSETPGRFSFGPFCETKDTCVRCAFLVPSIQTGRTLCQAAGWCERCCRASTRLDGDSLRWHHIHTTSN